MTSGIPRAAILFLILIPQAGRGATAQTSLPDAPTPLANPQSVPDCAPRISGQFSDSDDCDEAPAPPYSVTALQVGVPPPGCPLNLSTATLQQSCCKPPGQPFRRFLRIASYHPMTPRQKLLLATKNTFDPFNLLTIVGTSAISIASDPDTTYGPGLKGVGRNSIVAFAESATGEYIGTFLIPSLVHQDPHYHRMPNASMRRRIAHAFYQVVWTQSDTGKPMFNYATVAGTVAEDTVNDLYVPGRKLGPGSSALRIGTAIATDPIDNFITEFVPDLARRVKFRAVFAQRIVDQVAQEETRSAAD